MKTKYPTLKGIAYKITYPKNYNCDKGNFKKEKLGTMLLPNGFHAEKCANAVFRKFKQATAFSIYDNTGCLFFCGTF